MGVINEKRLYTRVTSNIAVSIYYNKSLIATCRATNIGVGGILLESNDLGLSVNSLVNIRFEVGENQYLCNKFIPAIVNRIEGNTLALSFEMLDKGTEQIIQQEIINSHNNTGEPEDE